jgi:hypothetical protein
MFLVMEPVDASVNRDRTGKVDEKASATRAGIYTHQSRYHPEIGCSKIDIFLTGSAGQRLFDARSVRFQTAANEVLQYFTIGHPNHLRGSRNICAGLFTIYAHNHTQYWEGLTFGGTVTVTSHYDYTHVEIESPAPIFTLMGDADPIQHLLFDEIMAAIARHRAVDHESDSQFAHRLATADPYKLFLAALATLQALVKHGTPSMTGGNHFEVQRAVQRMITAVRNTDGWPDSVPLIDDLL